MATGQGLLLPDWEIGGFCAAELALSHYGSDRMERKGTGGGGERLAVREREGPGA